MQFNEYQSLAQRTSNPQLSDIEKLHNGLMGLNGEAGECIDILKKHDFQGHTLAIDKILDELGDVLWYVAEAAIGINVSLEEIAQHNIAKLRARYPAGFSADRSINR